MEENELRRELREALTAFKSGVQVATMISCLAIGVSMGAVVVSGSSELAGSMWGLAVALLVGLITAAAGSYSLYRAEMRRTLRPGSGQAQRLQGQHGYEGCDQCRDQADDGGPYFRG